MRSPNRFSRALPRALALTLVTVAISGCPADIDEFAARYDHGGGGGDCLDPTSTQTMTFDVPDAIEIWTNPGTGQLDADQRQQFPLDASTVDDRLRGFAVESVKDQTLALTLTLESGTLIRWTVDLESGDTLDWSPSELAVDAAFVDWIELDDDAFPDLVVGGADGVAGFRALTTR